jgi:hypothetical protein
LDAFRDLNGGDYRLLLTVMRALVLGFLALGLAKARRVVRTARHPHVKRVSVRAQSLTARC